ncbi:MAG: DUF3109 family protein [Planctomycetes bacterium]|nr:DUF3109 family protein [Planctomycetota bacterium]
MSQQVPIEVENLATARFDCVFPTCGGVCCKNGRPSVELDEERRIAKHLSKFLPHLSPRARARIEASGFVTARKKEGLPMLAVVDGWCVYANEGCVLHKVGASEGDRFRYKPWRCAVFPLEKNPKSGRWHVRQWGVKGEAWDLFCLNPKESPKRAERTLAGELEHAARLAAPDAPSKRTRARKPSRR